MSEEQDMFGLPKGEEERQQLLDQGMDDVPSGKWATTLVEYVRILEALYRRRGMEVEAAQRLAMDSALELGEYQGGRVIYLPRGDKLRLAIKHAEIYRRSKRGNIEALAAEFGLTVPQIYRIVREQGVLHRAKIQGTLFATSET